MLETFLFLSWSCCFVVQHLVYMPRFATSIWCGSPLEPFSADIYIHSLSQMDTNRKEGALFNSVLLSVSDPTHSDRLKMVLGLSIPALVRYLPKKQEPWMDAVLPPGADAPVLGFSGSSLSAQWGSFLSEKSPPASTIRGKLPGLHGVETDTFDEAKSLVRAVCLRGEEAKKRLVGTVDAHILFYAFINLDVALPNNFDREFLWRLVDQLYCHGALTADVLYPKGRTGDRAHPVSGKAVIQTDWRADVPLAIETLTVLFKQLPSVTDLSRTGLPRTQEYRVYLTTSATQTKGLLIAAGISLKFAFGIPAALYNSNETSLTEWALLQAYIMFAGAWDADSEALVRFCSPDLHWVWQYNEECTDRGEKQSFRSLLETSSNGTITGPRTQATWVPSSRAKEAQSRMNGACASLTLKDISRTRLNKASKFCEYDCELGRLLKSWSHRGAMTLNLPIKTGAQGYSAKHKGILRRFKREQRLQQRL
ncbi:hypothetical protein DENSPDRAFT_832692 [Dentipellis sp. KUC8613]|nr:hypothetical protein DENSPDRAFT_832692 [Dentipellis sp. KUC8613]